MYYRERGCLEIAAPLEALLEEIASDDAATAEAAHRSVLTTILESPRIWAEHDAFQTFSLLRQAPLEDLDKMAGRPEPWLAGETIRERTVRIREQFTSADEIFEDMRALWGPFQVAVDQWLDLATSPEAAEGASRVSMLSLIGVTLTADFPYDRVVALGMALALGQMRPDLAGVEIQELELEFLGTKTRLLFDGSAQQLLTGLLTRWLMNEAEPPGLQDGAVYANDSGDELSIEKIGTSHALSDRLAADVTRYVYRAVLSQVHDVQATAKTAGTESSDSIGDLLLLGHRLSAAMLRPFLGQAHERGFSVVIQDLEEAHEQYPLSEGRIPQRELFVPEVLGVGGGGVNPYLVLLLSFLRGLGAKESEERNDGGTQRGHRFWWTENVRNGLEALAQREGPGQLQNLQNLAHTEGVLDRFGSLLTLGVEGHAARLLELMEPRKPV